MSIATDVRRTAVVAVTVVLTLLATTLGLAPASAAVPKAPTGLSVSDEGPTPTFDWDRVNGATTYVVEANRSSSFGDATRIFSQATPNAAYVHIRRLPAGDVFWRVRAQNGEGQGPWSTSQLTVGQADRPSPKSPVNGESVTPPVDPPVLEWDVVPGAVAYQVEVANNETFTSPQSYTTRSTSFVVPNPQGVGNYYWRVRADFGSGLYTDWSFPADYAVAALPLIEGEDVSSPPTGTSVQDVVLEWAPVRGAQRYQLQVATDRSFNEIVDNQTAIYSTRYSPARTYPNNDYFWRVRAVNSAGEPTGWSTTPMEFQRRWSDRPSLVHPADQVAQAVGDPFFFEWTPVQHAQRYRLEVGTDPNFSPGTFQTCYTASTTYTAGHLGSDPCMPGSQGRVYYWRVLAVEPSTSVEVPSLYSPIQSFIYDSGPVVKTAPAAGATVDVPTLRWAAQREAERYTVVVKDNANREVARTTTYALSWTPRTALDPAAGPFTWSVVAIDQSGSTSPNYGSRSFNLSGDQPDDPGLAPLTPTTPAPSARFPSLTWEPMVGAASYRIEIGVAGTGYNLEPSTTAVLRNTFAYSALTDETDYFLAPETYRWRITAYDTSGASLGVGPYSTFTIDSLPDAGGQRIALTGSSTGPAATSCDKDLGAIVDEAAICKGVPSTPVLRWEPVPGASSYMVYLAEDRDLTQLVYGNSSTNSNIPRTQNTMWTPSGNLALPDNESGEAYFWYVRPCKSPSKCGPDPLNTDDAATNAFRKISPQVKQLSPAEDATVANQVTFTWEDYLATNERATFPAGVAGAPSSHLTADRYRIQVFASQAASSPIDDQVVDQTTYTNWRGTYPEGDLWWRVQATDAAGNGLAWTPLRRLHHETPYQNLNPDQVLPTGTQGPPDTAIEPAHNARVPGDVALRWTARNYDATWNLEIYRNDDTTNSPANLVYRGSTQQAAFAWTNQLPAADTAYRWRIQRRDSGGRLGAWSDWGRFFVRNSPVTLQQPGDGGYQPAAGPVFTWEAAPNAASYRVDLIGADGGSTFNVTTVATAWAADRRLASGSYTWRVRAFDATGGQIGVSDPRGFKVDDRAPTVVRWKPTSSPKRTANFVVTFSERVQNVTSRTLQLKVQGRNTPVRARVTLSRDGRTATLNPSTRLARRKTYTAYVRPKIRDVVGNRMAQFSWSVTTR